MIYYKRQTVKRLHKKALSSLILTLIFAPNSLAKITFSADIPFSSDEFEYVTELSQNDIPSPQSISYATKQLKSTKRFHKIDVSLDESSKSAHFTLQAHWIFKTVTVGGIWFGKNRYENLYLLYPGDVFDISLHEESVESIKKLLQATGYLNNSIVDEIVYDKKTKTITVHLTIKRGKRCKIDRIFYTGDPLEKRLKKEVARQLSGHNFSKKALLKTKKYIEANAPVIVKTKLTAKKKQVTICFEIHKKDKITFELRGNNFFSDKQIREDIIDEQNKPTWLLDPNIIAEEILHEYHKHGFWFTKIRYKKRKSNHLVFCINEGRRIQIDNIIITEEQANKHEKNKFFFQELLNKKHYDEKKLNEAIEKLRTFYIEHGFWNFAITNKSFHKQKKNVYTLELFVNKGKQFFRTKADKKQFVPFNPSWLSEKRKKILEQFQKKGYWNVEVQPKLTPIDGPHKLSVDWIIKTGKRVTFDKVFVRGSTRLPFKKIIKHIPFKKGDPWDRKKLDYTRKKLKNLGIFKHIALHSKKLSLKENSKPIVLTLLDDDPLELKVRGGYFLTSKNFLLKRESTYKFGCTMLIKNPCNLADKIGLCGNFTRFEQNIDLDYHIPHVYGTNIASNIKFYDHQYTHPLEVGSSSSAYEAEQAGFLVGLKKEYKSFCFWGINFGNEWMKTKRTRGNLKLSPNMINQRIPYFFIEPNIFIDQGNITFGSIKLMVPQKNRSVTYKILIEHSIFHNFGHKIIGALRMRFGHIFREKFEEIMPTERFFLGGPNTVRGYSKDTVPPLGRSCITQQDGSKKIEYTIQGGNSMLNGNIELRFPIYKSFGGTVFHDFGALSQSGLETLLKIIYPTTGFGLRYETPIGPIRFDIGWKWKKSFVCDSCYAWYLTIGQAF